MRLSRNLKLVLPVDTEKHGTVYAHATPITREVFEKYYKVIGRTFTSLIRDGFDVISGPSIAMIALKDNAEQTGTWDGPDGVREGLVAEIHRLTQVAYVNGSGKGWQTLLFEDAVREGVIDADDAREVDNALAFFTCVSSVMREDQLTPIRDGMALLWDAQFTPSSCTEFARSLPTSTETETSLEPEEASSGTPSSGRLTRAGSSSGARSARK